MTIETQKKTKPPFNQASAAKPVTDASYNQKTMAVLIDIQLGTIDLMKSDDARAYLDHVAEIVTDLRHRNVPVTWTVISENDTLHAPDSKETSGHTRILRELENMGFLGNAQDEQTAAIFCDFLKQYGPKTSEAILEKSSIPTFNEQGHFSEYLNNLATENLVVAAGAVNPYCPIAAARDAALLDYNVFMCPDGMASWEGEPRHSDVVWHNDTNYHRNKIKAALNETISDAERDISVEDRIKLRNITTSSFPDTMRILEDSTSLNSFLSQKSKHISFPQYQRHGVTAIHHPGSFIELVDTNHPNGIVGTTTFNRDPKMFDRLITVTKSLQELKDAPVKTMFVPCSAGMEPFSFSKRLNDAGLLQTKNYEIEGLDISDAFIACAKDGYFPTEALEFTDQSWDPYLILEADTDYARLAPSIANSVHFHDAQNILDHNGQYDSVVMMNFLYHLPDDILPAVLSKSFEMSDGLIVMDDMSYKKVSETPGFFDIMEGNGFVHLDLANPSDTNVETSENENTVLLVKQELAGLIAQKVAQQAQDFKLS